MSNFTPFPHPINEPANPFDYCDPVDGQDADVLDRSQDEATFQQYQQEAADAADAAEQYCYSDEEVQEFIDYYG